ncbi:ParB/RepB/Spo0J family partition protein [Planococcus lenghuensis]|uniref:Chromosome partitioning protein ParB n=1 Tax=Planococcus lenghuensis TaxID=2213202 RepID=A0A1Q2L4D2_9BACL|nr:ParB/RepB/Spo0J family partition protein [Planococcus lenghuensis]AQQ54927.1 chromosome partitioning protein ParB [Planococcus lenghuensis]
MAKGLGKGLNALFPGEPLDKTEKVEMLQLNQLRVNPYQPRKLFDEEALQELAESIKEHGILQPIVVRESGEQFEIVVGERRYRAAQLLKLKELPAIVKQLTDQQMMELAILENLQREDLTPIEEAEAYHKLMDALNLTQEQLAFRLGKSRPHIANHLRLLALPEAIRTLISEKKLTMGHGRALLGLKKKKMMDELAEKTVREGLNVRQLESLIQRLNENVPRETITAKKDIFVQEKESELRDYFGTSVQIKKTKNKGKIEIEFFSEEDLERILDLLN